MVLDLAIPFDSPDGNPSIDHGVALALHIRNNFPGLPILVLTGQSSEEAVEALEENNPFAYFWDGGKIKKNLFKIRKKSKLPEALRLVASAAADLKQLDSFELDLQDQFCRELDRRSQRAIKLFSKFCGLCSQGQAARRGAVGGEGSRS